jgi:uncharacterized damage-inducible protein DinB
MDDYVQRNARSRARLASLCNRLTDEQLARIAFGDWTISAVLAHLAFWDRIALERWKLFEKDRQPIPVLADIVNTAGAAGWLATPPREAARLAVEAADAVDGHIEGLPQDLIDAATPMNPRMFERFHHRDEHLSAIEAVVGS